MATSDLRKAYFELLMEPVRSCRYPSTTMLERVELAARDRESLEELSWVLVDLMRDEEFPSPPMLERLSLLIDKVDGAAGHGGGVI